MFGLGVPEIIILALMALCPLGVAVGAFVVIIVLMRRKSNNTLPRRKPDDEPEE